MLAASPPYASHPARVAEVTLESASAIEAAMGDEGDRVAMRMQRGCRCFSASIGPDIAGYGWVSTAAEWIGEPELEISPPRGEAYIWNCVTLPAYRRRGVFAAMLRAIKAQLRNEALTRAWIGSLEDPAENAVQSAGFTPLLRLDSTTRWGFRWLRIRPAYKIDRSLALAATAALGARGVPMGSGFYLRRAERRRH